MPTGLSIGVGSGILALVLNGTTYTAGTGPLFLQLHLNDPGPLGTLNIAANTIRQASGTWTVTATSTTISAVNNAAISWTAVPASETYEWFSLWTASSGGTFIGAGLIAGGAVLSGSTFTLPAGQAKVTMLPAE